MSAVRVLELVGSWLKKAAVSRVHSYPPSEVITAKRRLAPDIFWLLFSCCFYFVPWRGQTEITKLFFFFQKIGFFFNQGKHHDFFHVFIQAVP